ncbi:hypothetical protein [Nocardioides pocheonensis]|uniref:Cobyrinic acid a,c-diamide synthase n=1 Tax=Nocardioides pocheonensis TaxID=661485 RepID=A0A3N0GFY4_9ACTN|nr:hypothetical protein [Nocardioides pocheonensis]RNM11082.1 hypothetical protein EFL26_23315 [Nocardioides pocheonensis]
MSRRVSLPNADDLFRPTAPPDGDRVEAEDAPAAGGPRRRPVAAVPEPAEEQPQGRRSSGRVRHDEKMTVYVTANELLDIEHTRLTLRRDHGLAVDRGRLVREALAIVLADLEENGDDSELIRRLLG